MPVTFIESLEDFDSALQGAGDKLVVVDFTATWCGPCKMIAPFFEELSNTHTTVVFLKVDVDEASDVSEKCGISCMPTFHFYHKGEKVREFSGANRDTLKQILEELKNKL